MGRDVELAAGMAGDIERAFLTTEGEGTSSSSSAASSSPLMGRLAKGELRAGRVDGLLTPRRPDVGVLEGGADVARSRGGAVIFVTGGGGEARSAGEPGGVVLPARLGVVLGGSAFASLGGV